ncbi:MAG: D-alanyl-D-alanine carboxypeptidase, partial [Burkholderiales bacterium]|nr:D-alanyl-D-alanine carboxypeptidase [Burkholderiales bacterium]
MRRWAVATALAACLPAFAQGPSPALTAELPTELPPELTQALQAGKVPADAASFLVWPLDGSAPRLQHQADASRLAASVMKLFTTGAALRTLGPAHTWRTEVGLGGPVNRQGALGGPLHVRGGGDPSLVMERVQQMVGRWRAAGLSDIRGDIVIDRGLFSLPEHDTAAFDGQGLKPYNAGADALLLNHQAVTLRFTPDASQPERARVTLEPALHGVSLDADLKLLPGVPCGDWRGALKLSMT